MKQRSIQHALLLMVFSLTHFADAAQHPVFTLNTGHAAEVRSVCFSGDGRLALSGSGDRTMRLWDLATGKEIRSFIGHTERVNAVCFSPDGRFALSGSDDNTLKLWDVLTGKLCRSFTGHSSSVTSVCFSPDGRYIVSGSVDESVRLWDAASGTALKTFKGHWSYVTSVCFSPDGKSAISGSDDKTIRLWDVVTGAELRAFKGHTGRVQSVCFSHDGKYILSGSDDATLRLWDASSGASIRIFKGHSLSIESVCFSQDDQYALSGSGDMSLKLWQVSTGKKIRTLVGHSGRIASVCISPDGRYALSGGGENALKLWDLSTGKNINTFSGYRGMISSVCFSRDGNYALSGSGDNSIKLWDIRSGAPLRVLNGHESGITSVAFSPDGRYALSGSLDRTAKLWDAATGAALRTFFGHSRSVMSVCFSPDGQYILTGSEDKTLILWDASTGKKIKTFSGSSGEVLSVCFSPDGQYILSGGEGTLPTLWKVSTGSEVKKFYANVVSVSNYAVCFSPDGKYALAGCFGKRVDLFDVASGKAVGSFQGHADCVRAVAVSPDGKCAVSGCDDNTIRIWSIPSGALVRTLTGHTSKINSVCYAPDGKTILSASSDNTIRLWDAASGTLLYTAIANADGSRWVVYNEEGYWDASSNGGDIVSMVSGRDVWNIDQFAARNNRPDKILSSMPGASPELIDHYQHQYKKRLKKLRLTESQLSKDFEVPEVKIVNTSQRNQSITVDFTIASKTGKLQRYNLFVNDVPLFGAQGKDLAAKTSGNKNAQLIKLTETIELIAGANKIELSAVNEFGAESFRALTFAEFEPTVQAKPDLYFLGFGVSKYKHPELDLRYADKDATDLAAAFEAMKGSGRFSTIHTKTILNEAVTPDAIKAAKAFVRTAKAEDTFVLFIAGHGTHDTDDDATYYYLTSNADPRNLKGTAANFDAIEDLLQGIAPRNKLFLMDACESGESDDDVQTGMIAQADSRGMRSRGFKSAPAAQAVQSSPQAKRAFLYQRDRYIYNDLARRSGSIVFSSSKGGELSYERSDIQNGLFTSSLLKAFTVQTADADSDGVLTTDELRRYVAADVGKASGDLQHPVVDRDNLFQKFGFPTKASSIPAPVHVTDSFKDPRDGRVYKTMTLGNQTWMIENLNFETPDGSWCYDDDPANGAVYGRLYNWKTAKTASPPGWHLASKAEWEQLMEFLGGGKGVVGGKLKEAGSAHWTKPNAGASNSSGFFALPGGRRNQEQTYSYSETDGYWWTSSEDEESTRYAWSLRMSNIEPIVDMGCNDVRDGYAIRCVRDRK
jgi:uncharacterized protein (TIGR02145 family)